eukprot:15315018-Alexandrium_andersonii.AAC.1
MHARTKGHPSWTTCAGTSRCAGRKESLHGQSVLGRWAVPGCARPHCPRLGPNVDSAAAHIPARPGTPAQTVYEGVPFVDSGLKHAFGPVCSHAPAKSGASVQVVHEGVPSVHSGLNMSYVNIH